MLRPLAFALLLAASAAHAQPADTTAWIVPADWDVDWREATRGELVRSAEALGITPLSDIDLPTGSTEVRLWTLRDIFAPDVLVQLVARGGGATGEMRNFWAAQPPDTSAGERIGETFHDGMVDWLRGQCDHVRREDEIGSCTVEFTREPDWTDLTERVAALADEALVSPRLAYQTCPPEQLCISIDHSATQTLEVRSGARYRAFSFRESETEDRRDGSPPSSVVAADSAFSLVARSLLPLMRRPDGELRYRGVFTKSDEGESLFAPCESDETWIVRQGYPLPLDDVASGDSVLVDGIGYLTPRWQSAQYGEPRPVFSFRSISSVEAWDGRPCEGP